MKNIHILPTDKPSRLRYNLSNILVLTKEAYRDYRKQVNQNIYITSDEKPRQEEWCLDLDTNTVFKIGNWKTNRAKKIILTDDEELIKDGVQAIDDDFLEWFCSKNGKVDFVEMKLLDAEEKLWEEYYKKNSIYPKYPWYYKIIIPKEEPKKDLEKEMFELEQELDIPSHLRWHNSIPKQETLEQAAYLILRDYGIKSMAESINVLQVKRLMVKMANWQQEQNKNLYSEEEVHKILGSYSANKEVFSHKYTYDMWFEQFKKK